MIPFLRSVACRSIRISNVRISGCISLIYGSGILAGSSVSGILTRSSGPIILTGSSGSGILARSSGSITLTRSLIFSGKIGGRGILLHSLILCIIILFLDLREDTQIIQMSEVVGLKYFVAVVDLIRYQ